jgi:hypothetical protein
LNEKHLGPYKGEHYISAGKTVKLELINLNDLVPGINFEKVILGKVVCWIQDSDSVPL